MKLKAILLLVICCMLCAFITHKNLYFKVPQNWPKPTYDFTKNPLSKERIFLGRVLFYDPILSKDNSTSCASCHSQYTAFAHADHNLSHGIHDRIGTRNAPGLMNLAWHHSFMWDGAINHLDMQALAPISNPLEMDETIQNVVIKLKHSKLYPTLFLNAFGDSIITGEHTLKAMAQFMLTLVSSNSKYDSVMLKQCNFTAQENKGYTLFKKNCASCHSEPLFTNLKFENNGLAVDPDLKDYGRIKITKNSKDSLKFKVPTLRNIEFSFPYMHDGRFNKLSEVINHYTSGIKNSSTLSPQLESAIYLSSNDKVDLIAFLLTLTDKSFLFNPNFSYPKNILLNQTKE